MEDQKINYCFILSEEQMEFLRSKKYKNDRMECFMSLVTLAACEPKVVPVSKTKQVEILGGQVMIDNTQLAKLWGKDRKTIPKLLKAMADVGISSSQRVEESFIHTLHCLSGWYVDGRFKSHDFANRKSFDGTGIVHKDVPPAKVTIIETEVTKNKDEEIIVTNNGNSDASSEGKVAVVESSTRQFSSSSNNSDDRVNVSKFDANDKPATHTDNQTSPLVESSRHSAYSSSFPYHKNNDVRENGQVSRNGDANASAQVKGLNSQSYGSETMQSDNASPNSHQDNDR